MCKSVPHKSSPHHFFNLFFHISLLPFYERGVFSYFVFSFAVCTVSICAKKSIAAPYPYVYFHQKNKLFRPNGAHRNPSSLLIEELFADMFL